MELSNEEEHELRYLFHRLHHDYADEEATELSLISFGILLCNMERYKFASKLFRRILRDLPSYNHLEQAQCQRILGHVASVQHHYWQSLRWYKRALATYAMIDLEPHFSGVASVYNGIGHVYAVRKQYKQAHTSYQRALVLWKTHYGSGKDNKTIAFCYLHEARVYLAENRHERASALSRRALNILYKCHSNTSIHPDLISAHRTLGDALVALRMLDLAIDHYLESLIIAFKTLSPDDASLFYVYSDLEVACGSAGKIFGELLRNNGIPEIHDQIYIDHFNTNRGTRYQMVFKCPRCKRWQWIFTVFRPVKQLVCTGCWRKRCPRLMSYFWVLT
jgi:tetratricopeptide (TPR) repeat protein